MGTQLTNSSTESQAVLLEEQLFGFQNLRFWTQEMCECQMASRGGYTCIVPTFTVIDHGLPKFSKVVMGVWLLLRYFAFAIVFWFQAA